MPRPLALAALLLAAPAAAQTVFLAPPLLDTAPGSGTFTQGEPGTFYSQRIADNFVLDADAAVTGATWWGRSEGFVFDDLTNFRAFSVQLWTSDGQKPDTLLLDATIDTPDTNPVEVATSFQGSAIYRHDVALPATDLQAGVEYWFTVGALFNDTGSSADAYVWQYAAPDDRVVGLDRLDGNGWSRFTSLPADFSFAISVPEPATAATAGLAALLVVRRRR